MESDPNIKYLHVLANNIFMHIWGQHMGSLVTSLGSLPYNHQYYWDTYPHAMLDNSILTRYWAVFIFHRHGRADLSF